jgi:hypothetical protein
MQSMSDLHFRSRLPVVIISRRGGHPATFAFDGIGGTGVSDMKKYKPSQLAIIDVIKGPEKASNISSGPSRVLREDARTQSGDHPVCQTRLDYQPVGKACLADQQDIEYFPSAESPRADPLQYSIYGIMRPPFMVECAIMEN